MIGRVVSTKTQKTVTVLVERIVKHPLYKKTYAQSKRFLVDDPIGVVLGDVVEVAKVRPISKNKHWRVAKVVGKNLEAITAEVLKTAADRAVAEVMPEEESNKLEIQENKHKEVVMDNSADESKSKKKGRTKLSKK